MVPKARAQHSSNNVYPSWSMTSSLPSLATLSPPSFQASKTTRRPYASPMAISPLLLRRGRGRSPSTPSYKKPLPFMSLWRPSIMLPPSNRAIEAKPSPRATMKRPCSDAVTSRRAASSTRSSLRSVPSTTSQTPWRAYSSKVYSTTSRPPQNVSPRSSANDLKISV